MDWGCHPNDSNQPVLVCSDFWCIITCWCNHDVLDLPKRSGYLQIYAGSFWGWGQYHTLCDVIGELWRIQDISQYKLATVGVNIPLWEWNDKAEFFLYNKPSDRTNVIIGAILLLRSNTCNKWFALVGSAKHILISFYPILFSIFIIMAKHRRWCFFEKFGMHACMFVL